MPRMIELAADFTDDETKAIATRKNYWAEVFIPALFTEKIYTPKMSEENGKAVGADTIRQSVCISADPDVHVKFARRYIDLGFNHLNFHAAGPDQSAFIEQYGRHGCRDCAKIKSKNLLDSHIFFPQLSDALVARVPLASQG